MLSPVDLHDIALTLENERAFHDAYNNGGTHRRSALQRRELIRRFIPAAAPDTTGDREQLRRYFDDAYNLPECKGDNSLAHLPTVEFWLDSVKYPDNPIYKSKQADDPKPAGPLVPVKGQTFNIKYLREAPSGRLEWLNFGKKWKVVEEDELYQMFWEGCDLRTMSRELQRPPGGVLDRLVALRCLRQDFDVNTTETVYVVQAKPPQRKHTEAETYASEPVPEHEVLQQEVADHLTQAANTFSNLANNLKEIIMNKTDIIVIETKTLINGVDIATFADSEIYDLIAKQEAEIETLDKIKTKPKKLVAEIEKRKAGIDALVAYLDSKPE